MVIGIKNIYTKDTCISSTYIVRIKIRYASIKSTYIKSIYARSILVKSVKPRVLVGSRVILINLRINN